jgi:IS5 family transposase
MTRPSNPSPRPALRKAPDASVHPAAPVVTPYSPPAVVPSKEVPKAAAEPKRRVHLRPVVGLGGKTSDVLRTARVQGDEKKARAKQAKKLSKKARQRRERRVELQVKVPKELRKKLRQNAKARGTSVDDVVTAVLEGWLRD